MSHIVIVSILFISLMLPASANAVTKESILKTCQDMIKKDTKVHPRLINIQEYGKYKYSFDVTFIKQGKEVDWLKNSIYDKNYACEYYPEEETIYKTLSVKQLAKDDKKRIEKAIAVKNKAIKDAKNARLEEKRKAEAAKKAKIRKAEAIKAENNRIDRIKSNGSEYYAQKCHASMSSWERKTYKIIDSGFKDNFKKILIKMKDTTGRFDKKKTCKISELKNIKLPIQANKKKKKSLTKLETQLVNKCIAKQSSNWKKNYGHKLKVLVEGSRVTIGGYSKSGRRNIKECIF